MAVDTADKRSSCVGLVGPYRQVFPAPTSGGIDTSPERAQVAYSYAGVFSAPSPPAPVFTPRFLYSFGGMFVRQTVLGSKVTPLTAPVIFPTGTPPPPPPPPPPPIVHTGSIFQTFLGQATHSWSEGLIVIESPDGGYYVGGTCDLTGNYTGGLDTFTGTNFVWVLSRYSSDGLLRTDFATYGQLQWSFGGEDDELSGLCVQSDDKIVCAGIHWNTSSGQAVKMFRLGDDGTQDLQFGSVFSGNTSSLYSSPNRNQNCQIELQSSGNVVLYSTDVVAPGNNRLRVSRFHADGSTDTLFGTQTTVGGIVVTTGLIEIQPSGDTPGPAYYGHILVQSDDKIVVGGSHDTGSVNYKGFVTRVLADGSVMDSGFGANLGPNATGGTAYGLLVDFGHGQAELPGVTLDDASGDILCVGNAARGGGVTGGAFALSSSAGVLDTGFNGTGFLTTVQGDQPWNFLFQPAQVGTKVFGFGMAANTSSTVDPTTKALGVSFNMDGTLNTSWGTGGVFLDPDSNGMSLFFDVLMYADGSVIGAGHRGYNAVPTIAQARILRILSTGALDTAWGDVSPPVTIPTTPTVVTGSASAVTATSATLSGTVNPNGQTPTTCHFEWGLDANYGQKSAEIALASGSTPQNVSANVSGLVPNNVKGPTHFRLAAMNGNSTIGLSVGVGSDATFSTSSGTFTLWSDSFAGTNGTNLRDHMPGLTYTGGKYVGVKGVGSIQSGKARFDSDPSAGAGNKGWIVQVEGGTGKVTVRGTITSALGSDGNQSFEGVFGLCVSHNDGDGLFGNWLFAGWDNQSRFKLSSLVGGNEVILASTSFTPSAATPYALALTIDPGTTSATATLNGGSTLTTSAVPAQLLANTQFGWVTTYSIGDTIDDVSVTTP